MTDGYHGCDEPEEVYDALAADDEHLDDNKAAIGWNGSDGAASIEAEITRLRDALKIAREALLAELETPSKVLAHVALAAWREHLRFHTIGDENGEPVFKSTSHEAMTAALKAVAAHLKEQSA